MEQVADLRQGIYRGIGWGSLIFAKG